LLAILEGHTRAVSALAVLGDGRLASGSRDGTIKLWNPQTQRCEATLEGHTRAVSARRLLDGENLDSIRI
jgi:WD40 repeat protein